MCLFKLSIKKNLHSTQVHTLVIVLDLTYTIIIIYVKLKFISIMIL